MKKMLSLFLIMSLAFSCKKTKSEPVVIAEEIKVDDTISVDSFQSNLFKNDSISIDVKNTNSNFSIVLNTGAHFQEYDLTKLNVLTRSPFKLQWVNHHYACIQTWWSNTSKRFVFIPLKQKMSPIYFDKDIQEMDSITNNIVLIDKVDNKDKAVFKIENLVTSKSKTFDITINNVNKKYPFYESLLLLSNKLIVTTSAEQKNVDLVEINEE